MGSTRLPGKVLKKIRGAPLLAYQIERVLRARHLDKIVVATTRKREDSQILRLCKSRGIDCFRGADADVLDRFVQCAGKYASFKVLARLTGDCPLIDPKVIDRVVDFYRRRSLDYVTNTLPPTFPDGMDVEVFSRKALMQAGREAKLNSEREHVTLYLRNRKKFSRGNLRAKRDFSHIRLTVDDPEDFEVIKFLIEHGKPADGYLDYIALLQKNPKVMQKNLHLTRNEGLSKSLREDYKIKP